MIHVIARPLPGHARRSDHLYRRFVLKQAKPTA